MRNFYLVNIDYYTNSSVHFVRNIKMFETANAKKNVISQLIIFITFEARKGVDLSRSNFVMIIFFNT